MAEQPHGGPFTREHLPVVCQESAKPREVAKVAWENYRIPYDNYTVKVFGPIVGLGGGGTNGVQRLCSEL
ncbi:Hypothetical predicted protein [Podarcis lilfordi]|uniref:Uncharacterized protein n=1 Tax=Podarcis lilfordi TaxID=74358 RepID=A0AA35PBG6_9SAUR|nr:Hypothetical predicted protein [Podarcis lilfordi]